MAFLRVWLFVFAGICVYWLFSLGLCITLAGSSVPADMVRKLRHRAAAVLVLLILSAGSLVVSFLQVIDDSLVGQQAIMILMFCLEVALFAFLFVALYEGHIMTLICPFLFLSHGLEQTKTFLEKHWQVANEAAPRAYITRAFLFTTFAGLFVMLFLLLFVLIVQVWTLSANKLETVPCQKLV